MSNKPSRITRFIQRFPEYDESRKVISYDAMRRSIGILGMSLPFILIFGSALFYSCCWLPESVSQYYHTGMRDFFVGILFFVALFLFAYRGYNILDRIAGIIAGAGALGVALFPAEIISEMPGCIIDCVKTDCWKTWVHIISAALFFIVLALTSIFLFTQTYSDDVDEKTTNEKITRNKIYRACGIIMLVSLLLIMIYRGFIICKFPDFDKLRPVFWLETIALTAFGISWLVKGKAGFKDK